MKYQPPIYRTFLITVWQEPKTDLDQWRFVLTNPASGERIGFVSYEAVVSELKRQVTDLQQDLSKTQNRNQENHL